MSPRSIAVIPARGGSKRIKNKNIRPFAGKPLIAYSIEAALDSEQFENIVVSTDSVEIADVATQSGASEILMRPAELSDDHTGTSPVVRHAINEYESKFGQIDTVCCVYATAPFLTGLGIAQGHSKLQQHANAKFAFSVTTFDFPIQRALRLDGEGVAPVDSQYMGTRSQDLEERYHDAGQFYWGTKQAWLDCKPMFKSHSLPVVLPRYLVQDIDTEEDWLRAELMYRAYVSIGISNGSDSNENGATA